MLHLLFLVRPLRLLLRGGEAPVRRDFLTVEGVDVVAYLDQAGVLTANLAPHGRLRGRARLNDHIGPGNRFKGYSFLL